jgi:hypothetical protein
MAAFREARLPRVRAYVAEVCSPEHSEEAISATFVDFQARAPDDAGTGDHLDRVLLRATRSAAGGRFAVVVPQGRPELSLTAECRTMPELLALHANGERAGDEALIGDHLSRCAICAHTLSRMQRADRAFSRATGELPALEIEPTSVDTTKAPPPTDRPATPPIPGGHNAPPEPESAFGRGSRPSGAGPPPGAPYRRRSGGLVGAIRKLGRPEHG